MRKIYYQLYHDYEEGDEEISKLIGVFSSEENAKKEIELLKDKPGFKDYPLESFVIGTDYINEYWWKEGFISWKEASED